MISDSILGALKIVAERMQKTSLCWSVIGSTNMALQGMDVEPQDLDIVLRLDDLKKIPEIFSGIIVSDVRELPTITGEPAWEVKMEIEGVTVQILGEKDSGQYVSKLVAGRTTEVNVNGLTIPCFTLKAEADAYSETNRKKKAEMIKEFLRSGQ